MINTVNKSSSRLRRVDVLVAELSHARWSIAGLSNVDGWTAFEWFCAVRHTQPNRYVTVIAKLWYQQAHAYQWTIQPNGRF